MVGIVMPRRDSVRDGVEQMADIVQQRGDHQRG
jgi:dipeptidase